MLGNNKMDTKSLNDFKIKILSNLLSKKNIIDQRTYSTLYKEFKNIPQLKEFKSNQNPLNEKSK